MDAIQDSSYKLECNTEDHTGIYLKSLIEWKDEICTAFIQEDKDIHIRFGIPKYDVEILWDIKIIEVEDGYSGGGVYKGLRINICGCIPHHHPLQDLYVYLESYDKNSQMHSGPLSGNCLYLLICMHFMVMALW